jgi:hypothetical protein
MSNYRFSGHETFIIRSFWPKKGYDFLNNGGKFSDEDAVVKLGVGKNMVSSIAFWMKALGLYDSENNALTKTANFLLGKNGVDPYLEDIASIWLLHYNLVSSGYASIYWIVFNEFRKRKTLFTRQQLEAYVKTFLEEQDVSQINENTIKKDLDVFLRLYNVPNYKLIKKNFEDELSSLMLELGLVNSTVESTSIEGKVRKEEWFNLRPTTRDNLPALVTLFAILDQNPDSDSISLRRLETITNNIGLVFLLSKEGLYEQVKKIEEQVSGINVSETAGNVVVTFPEEKLNKWDVLKKHYEK